MEFMSTYAVLFSLLSWLHLTRVDAQGSDCDIASPVPVTFSETDPPQVLLEVHGGPTALWNFRVETLSPFLDPYFRLEQEAGSGNATLSLKKTMDLEVVFEQLGQIVNNIKGKLSCSQSGVPDVEYEWYVFVTPVNEFPPEFISLPADGFDIMEDTRIGDIVFILEKYVEDKDVVPNDLGFDFSFIPYTADSQVDGREMFSIQNSLTGSTAVSRQLDYETMPASKRYYILNVEVSDRDNTITLTSTATVRINIIDADDQPPEFYYQGCTSPCFTAYSAAIRTDFVGAINWLEPAPIQARDLDTLGSPVTFRIKQGDPAYFADYLSIDSQTGVPSVVKAVESAETASFLVIVEAVEVTNRSHSEQTTLWLVIEGRNLSLPASSPASSTADFYRITTIVLGCLLGLILIIFIIFVVVTTLTMKKKTMPVQPRAIGKLSNDTSDSAEAGEASGNPGTARESSRGDRRESNGVVSRGSTRRKLSGDSGVDFFRSLSTPSGMGPALRPSSFLRTEQDETLPGNDEIYYTNSATRQKASRVSTTSESGPSDRMGLVGSLSEEVLGMANPVYGVAATEDKTLDVSVVPLEQAHVQI